MGGPALALRGPATRKGRGTRASHCVRPQPQRVRDCRIRQCRILCKRVPSQLLTCDIRAGGACLSLSVLGSGLFAKIRGERVVVVARPCLRAVPVAAAVAVAVPEQKPLGARWRALTRCGARLSWGLCAAGGVAAAAAPLRSLASAASAHHLRFGARDDPARGRRAGRRRPCRVDRSCAPRAIARCTVAARRTAPRPGL